MASLTVSGRWADGRSYTIEPYEDNSVSTTSDSSSEDSIDYYDRSIKCVWLPTDVSPPPGWVVDASQAMCENEHGCLLKVCGNAYKLHMRMAGSKKLGLQAYWVNEIRDKNHDSIVCLVPHTDGRPSWLWTYSVWFIRCLMKELFWNRWISSE